MPSDSRRVQVPDVSTPYQNYCAKTLYKDSQQALKDLLKDDSTRKDGRKPFEARPICLKQGVSEKAKGSAYIEQGQTKVICSVFDPREIPSSKTSLEYQRTKGELYVEFKFAPFASKIRTGWLRDSEEKELGNHLKRALEPAVCRHEFPNFQVDIFVLVLQNDGSALSAAINCANLALADAAIPMYDMVTSTTLALRGGLTFLDPLEEEATFCQSSPLANESDDIECGILTVSYMSVIQQVTQVTLVGTIEQDLLASQIERIVEQCESLCTEHVQKLLVRNLIKEAKE
uniref:Exosome complex component MTR3 n=1 Tax=Cacopsylla melanoneura TaxID=428564 RepID=A0A8D8SC88_9HEMI